MPHMIGCLASSATVGRLAREGKYQFRKNLVVEHVFMRTVSSVRPQLVDSGAYGWREAQRVHLAATTKAHSLGTNGVQRRTLATGKTCELPIGPRRPINQYRHTSPRKKTEHRQPFFMFPFAFLFLSPPPSKIARQPHPTKPQFGNLPITKK